MKITATVLAVSTTFNLAQQDSIPVRDSIVLLEELVVSGTRSGEAPRLEQPMALSIAVPSLRERAAGTVAANLLRDLAGVQVQQTSAGQGAVILRGLIGNQVLLLVDGIPMNNGTYRDGPGQYLATIDPEAIERIEVIRGPASVLYGSDAQGGAVNIITRPHPYSGARSIRLSGSASSADRGYRARVSAGVIGSRLSVAVGGTLISAGDLRAGEGLGAQVPTRFDAEGLDAEVTYHLDGHHVLEGVVQHFAMHDVPRYDRYVDFRAPALGRDAEHLFEPQIRQLAYARYTFAPRRPALTRLEATVSLTAQREGRSQIKLTDSGTPEDLRTGWRDDVYTPGVSLVGSSLVTLGGRTVMLTWGGDFYHDRLNTRGHTEVISTGTQVALTRTTETGTIPTGNFPDGANADRIGVFISAETLLMPWLRLSAGGRWSRFHNEAHVGTEFGGLVKNRSSDLTGQFGLVAAPAPSWRIAARLAEGFRAPNLYDLTRTGPVPGGIALPNPDATPERSLSGELGVRYATATTAVDVTAYYTRITDFIDRVPGQFHNDTLFNGERVFQGRNVGTARVRGLEAEAAKVVGPLRMRATVLYTHGEQQSTAGVEEPMSKIPPLGGNASIRWTAPRRSVWIEYLLRWAARQDRLGTRDVRDPRIPRPDGTPGYAVHGLRVGARVGPEVDVSAGIENLTDELYRDHASGVDNPGRYVWVGVSWVGAL
ncbi:MAG: TonB-dependent receptor [Gemmatimonadales bacterium]|nr:TonB-dependent receptor [Gemmatimonadales bacterium]NIN12671.1 TonB-dependent receptor [Gemmatimonadales bacterium]NIN50951.1 TonB-dependent receptor [Gemmatimonadales bacterium]NIP08415.1 TonB-dependent receptor [Gemmatimonadales bacterium]NIR03599.1 TonB-dependent receptor [Gemmatimonadales bacterium]